MRPVFSAQMSPADRNGSTPATAGASELPMQSRRHGSFAITTLLETRGPLEAQLPAPAIKAFPIKAIPLPDPHETRGVCAFEMVLQGARVHVHQVRRLFPGDRERILPLGPAWSTPPIGRRRRLSGASPSHHPILPEMVPSPPCTGLDWRSDLRERSRRKLCRRGTAIDDASHIVQ